MLKNICLSVATLAIAFTSLPASAQVRVEIPMPGLEIRVGHTAPPRMRSETRPPRPGKDYVWAGGSWDWRGNSWAWAPGRWDRPGDHGSRWVKARYVREGNAWRHEPGHWSNQRLVEGDDYRRWKGEQHGNQGHGRDRDGNDRH